MEEAWERVLEGLFEVSINLDGRPRPREAVVRDGSGVSCTVQVSHVRLVSAAHPNWRCWLLAVYRSPPSRNGERSHSSCARTRGWGDFESTIDRGGGRDDDGCVRKEPEDDAVTPASGSDWAGGDAASGRESSGMGCCCGEETAGGARTHTLQKRAKKPLAEDFCFATIVIGVVVAVVEVGCRWTLGRADTNFSSSARCDGEVAVPKAAAVALVTKTHGWRCSSWARSEGDDEEKHRVDWCAHEEAMLAIERTRCCEVAE